MPDDKRPLRIPGEGKPLPVELEPGRLITDPDEAEGLGLTADARRMRREQDRMPMGPPTVEAPRAAELIRMATEQQAPRFASGGRIEPTDFEIPSIADEIDPDYPPGSMAEAFRDLNEALCDLGRALWDSLPAWIRRRFDA